jgi:hypothetical protein
MDNLNSALSDLLTTQDVAELFRVTPMTVHLWRSGGLDAVVIPGSRFARPANDAGRPAVRFERRIILSWAQRTGRRIRASSPRSRTANAMLAA